MVKVKNLEIWEEILFGQTASEIPRNPPLIKGGRGDFWQGRGPPWKNLAAGCGSANLGIDPEK
jgi:hypothetical protein